MSQSRDDWLDAAWRMLGDGGVDAIRVEKLAENMGVTKGSFYWHFKNRRDLIDGLLDRWFSMREELQPEFITNYPSPEERLWKVLERLIIKRSAKGQPAALRLWAQTHEDVAIKIDEADDLRRNIFFEQFCALGFDRDESEIRADIYMAVISAEFLYSGHLSQKDRLAKARKKHDVLVNML